jgi:hypothetical protein
MEPSPCTPPQELFKDIKNMIWSIPVWSDPIDTTK